MGVQDGGKSENDRPLPVPWPAKWAGSWAEALKLCRNHAGQFARSRKLTEADAEDVSQEAMKQLVVHGTTVSAWQGFLVKTVRNCGKSLCRRKATERRHLKVAADDPTIGPQPVSDHALFDDQDERLVRSRLVASRLDLLDEMFGPHTRAIMDLRSEDIRWSDIAAMTKLPLGTCRERHRQARTWLASQARTPRTKEETHG